MKATFKLSRPGLTVKAEFRPRTNIPSDFYTANAIARMVEGLEVFLTLDNGKGAKLVKENGTHMAAMLRNPGPPDEKVFVTCVESL